MVVAVMTDWIVYCILISVPLMFLVLVFLVARSFRKIEMSLNLNGFRIAQLYNHVCRTYMYAEVIRNSYLRASSTSEDQWSSDTIGPQSTEDSGQWSPA